MEPIETTDTTDTLVGPEDSDIDPLPVIVEDGRSVSVWELDDEDRERIAEGGLVGLIVLMHPQPPVALIVASPYCPKCQRPMEWSAALKLYVCGEHDEDELE